MEVLVLAVCSYVCNFLNKKGFDKFTQSFVAVFLSALSILFYGAVTSEHFSHGSFIFYTIVLGMSGFMASRCYDKVCEK